jgi:type II secretion system (T2SS) protein M
MNSLLHYLGPYRAWLMFGIIIVLFAAGLRGLPLWLAWRTESRASAEDMLSRLAERQAVVYETEATIDSAKARIARFRKTGRNLILARDAAEAAATLASQLGEAARNSLVRIDAVQTRVDTAGRAQLRKVLASVDATGDITALATMLQRVEQGPAFLAVRQFSVNAENVHTPPEGVENLRFRLTVEARALISVRP